ISSIGVDGKTVTLAANGNESIAVDEGDRWQGVYRFDHYTVKSQVQVLSNDPIKVSTDQVVTGPVETDAIYADRLVVKSGGSVTQPLTTSAAMPSSLRIEVRELVVEAGGAIDVTSRGYAAGTTYPGHVNRTSASGGSHLGEGGPYAVVAETFGSVYFPQENGGGGEFYRGGGAIHIRAERVQVDGSIRANGEAGNRLGAGGSVWIETASLGGTGTIEAKGGSSTDSYGSGGGGAIAIGYTTADAGSTLLDHLAAQGGSTGITGGAGTIYLKSGSSTYGDLIVDNGTVSGNRRTILPSLGNGVAGSGSAGATLVTGRSKTIPAYFVGHWVEVRSSSGVLEGTWRISSIGVDGKTVTLAANGNESITVDEGDRWQGVYRFDHSTVKGQLQLISTDPIRVYTEQVITGPLETDAIYADRLVVKSGGSVTQPLTASASSPSSLRIEVRELVVET